MTTATLALIASVCFTTAALLAAFAVWNRSLNDHRAQMTDRTFALLKFGAPPLMMLTASPLFDAIALMAGGPFPVIGLAGPALGFAGAAAIIGLAVVDVHDVGRTAADSDIESADATA